MTTSPLWLCSGRVLERGNIYRAMSVVGRLDGGKGKIPYFAQRVVTVTLLLFGQATMRGERSIQPPVAKPPQPTSMGAVKVMYRGNGADCTSGMASEISSPLPGSE